VPRVLWIVRNAHNSFLQLDAGSKSEHFQLGNFIVSVPIRIVRVFPVKFAVTHVNDRRTIVELCFERSASEAKKFSVSRLAVTTVDVIGYYVIFGRLAAYTSLLEHLVRYVQFDEFLDFSLSGK
jgi:hypothetical protein